MDGLSPDSRKEGTFDGEQRMFARDGRMATRMTEAVQTGTSTTSKSPRPQAGGAEGRRDTFFASLSHELRWSLGADDRFRVLEGAWQPVLGWRPQRLYGWHWEDIVHPADRRRFGASLERLRAGGESERDVEVRLSLATGGHRTIRWRLANGAGGDNILGVGHDPLDEPSQAPAERERRARLEQQNADLAGRLAELEERYQTLERFAATAAHQLAEPLIIAESSAILVVDELGDDLHPMLRGRLDAIGRSAARARRLMDALLADARASSAPLEMRPVDLDDIVAETLGNLAAQIEQRRATAVPNALPRACGDASLLAVVFDNLVSNALKYGPREGGRIEISADRCPDGWRISVRGDGASLSAEDASVIFEPFRRATGERRVPGVGLGLAVCARLVARMNGRIGAEPGAVSGNTFWIVLPAAS